MYSNQLCIRLSLFLITSYAFTSRAASDFFVGKAKPRSGCLSWLLPGLRTSKAKAPAFRPSQARTSLTSFARISYRATCCTKKRITGKMHYGLRRRSYYTGPCPFPAFNAVKDLNSMPFFDGGGAVIDVSTLNSCGTIDSRWRFYYTGPCLFPFVKNLNPVPFLMRF